MVKLIDYTDKGLKPDFEKWVMTGDLEGVSEVRIYNIIKDSKNLSEYIVEVEVIKKPETRIYELDWFKNGEEVREILANGET